MCFTALCCNMQQAAPQHIFCFDIIEDVKEGLNTTVSCCCNAISLQMTSGNSIRTNSSHNSSNSSSYSWWVLKQACECRLWTCAESQQHVAITKPKVALNVPILVLEGQLQGLL